MKLRRRHLHDDRLLECYLALRQGETLDPRHAEHLADCGACAARYSETVAFMNGLQTAATAEADAVFTPDRLQAQRQAIARRIEHVGHPARVITFPRALGGDQLHTSAPHAPSRWVAMAAAAGLFIGVALGASLELRSHQSTATVAVAEQAPRRAQPARAVPVATDGENSAQANVATDDAFLSELEMWADRPRTRELMPLDSLTPRVREVSEVR